MANAYILKNYTFPYYVLQNAYCIRQGIFSAHAYARLQFFRHTAYPNVHLSSHRFLPYIVIFKTYRYYTPIHPLMRALIQFVLKVGGSTGIVHHPNPNLTRILTLVLTVT